MEVALNILLFVLGGIAVLLYQYYQSKEVLKQTIYIEKFQMFKNITSDAYKLYIEVTHYTSNGNDEDKLKVYKKLRSFQTTVQQHYFLLSKNVAKACQELSEISLNAIQTKQIDVKTLLTTVNKIDIAVQSELGLETLNNELKDLYNKFPSLSSIRNRINEEN